MVHLLKHLFFYSVFLFLIITPAYSKCPQSYPCRNFTLEYPFTDSNDPDCGLFKVHGCSNDSIPGNDNATVRIGAGEPYVILRKISKNIFLIRDLGLLIALSNRSCYSFSNQSLPQSPSVSFTFSPNLTLFTCYKNYAKEGLGYSSQQYNKTDCQISTVYYKTPAAARVAPAVGDISILSGCKLTQLPLKSENSSGDLFDMLSADFRLEWSVSKACYECYHGGGQCLADNENKLYCKQGTLNKLETLYLFSRLVIILQ